jgi:radical SAM-linked protein
MQTKKIPIVIKLEKSGEMIFFSQLDLIHVLERALRRTTLPLYYTQGFNPHVKISFLSGLKLGVEGEISVRLYFKETIEAEEVREHLSINLPEGLTIKEIAG